MSTACGVCLLAVVRDPSVLTEKCTAVLVWYNRSWNSTVSLLLIDDFLVNTFVSFRTVPRYIYTYRASPKTRLPLQQLLLLGTVSGYVGTEWPMLYLFFVTDVSPKGFVFSVGHWLRMYSQ